MVQKVSNYYSKTLYSVSEKQKKRDKTSFGNANQTNPQGMSGISKAYADYDVKVPMPYTKVGEINMPYGIKAHCYKLANGQSVVIVPKDGNTVLRTYVNTGSFNEPDNIRGISHYIEHNLFNGSEGLEAGEFFATADKIGADTNACTSMAETNYFISSNLLNDNDLEEEMRIHASMIESPKFALDMLEKEKGIVNSEINMATSEPGNIAFNETIKTLFNIKTTSEDVIAGTTDNITNLKREDVVNYYNTNYFPANMVTVVSGEVEPEDAMKLVSKYFTSRKSAPQSRHYENLVPIQETKRKDIISDKTQAANIVMGFVGPENCDLKSDIQVTALMSLLLESSEAKAIFKKDNANVNFWQEKLLANPKAPRMISVVAESSDENSEKVLKKIYSRIQKFQNQPVTEEQLKIVKRDIKKSFAEAFESSFAVNSYIGSAILDGQVNEMTNIESYIDSLTAKDIQDAAKKYLDLNKAAITVVHPETASTESISNNYNTAKSLSFTGKVKQAINMGNVKQYDLVNNYRVSVYDNPYPRVYGVISKRVEQPVYASNPAAYEVLNEILENGTMLHNREEFEKIQENDGTKVTLRADERGIAADFMSDADDYNALYKSLKEALENPRFTEETFNDAVKAVKDVVSRAEKTPWDKLLPVLEPKSGHTKEEILKGLETLTLNEVKDLYSQLYTKSHGIVSVAAPTGTKPQLNNNILISLSGLDRVNPYVNVLNDDYEPIKSPKVLMLTDNKSQADVLMAYKFVDNGNLKDRVTFDLLNQIFGGGPSSRLFLDLRESRKLAYSVRSRISRRNNTGRMILSIGTTTDNNVTGEKSYDNLPKSINGFKENINKIKSEKVSSEELEKAKLSLKNDILSGNEMVSDKNFSIYKGTSNWYGPNYENQYLEMIDQITVDDIFNAANYVFAGEPVYSIIATKNTLDANKDYLKSLEKM